MNYITFDLHNSKHSFILTNKSKEEVEYICVGGKYVNFSKEELKDDKLGIKLNIKGQFPTGISLEVTFLDRKQEEISYQVEKNGYSPMFEGMPGLLLFTNEKMYIKFMYLNNSLVDFDKLAIVKSVRAKLELREDYVAVKFKDDNTPNLESLLIVARENETNIKHVIPVYSKGNELVFEKSYMNGIFNLDLILIQGEHLFLNSFADNVNNYVPLFNQTDKVIKSDTDLVDSIKVENHELSIKLNSSTLVDRVIVVSHNAYVEINDEQLLDCLRLDASLFNHAYASYLIILKGNQYYYENLNDSLKKIDDPNVYNFNLNHIRNSEKVNIKNITVDDVLLSFDLIEDNVELSFTETPFLLVKLRNSNRIEYIRGKRVDRRFTFNFGVLLEEIQDSDATRWELYLINDYKSEQSYQIGDFENTVLERPKRFFKLFKQEFENNSTYKQHSRIYITMNNELAMVKNTLSNLVKEEYDLKIKVIHFYMKKNIVEMKIDIDSPYVDDFKLGSFYLINRNKDKIDKREIELLDHKQKHDRYEVKVRIDLSKLSFYPLYWDAYIGIVSNGVEYYSRIHTLTKSIAWDINETITRYQYDMADNDIFYPYTTLAGGISFTYREKEYFENRYYLFKENLAYLIVKLFSKYYEKRRIWLAYEKHAMSAHDSGYYFFDYVYKNKKHDEFYYIIRKDSPEIENLADKKDKIVYFMSFKYFIYMFAAELFFSSDTRRHSYNLKLKKSRLAKTLTDKKLVYLQHGVNGLKRVRGLHKDRKILDLVIAPSEFEKQMIINDWGFAESEVVATGLARWDGLRDKTNKIDYKQIFFMPTWRTWMDGIDNEDFKESEYFIKYNEFLSSKKLHKMLEENNIKLKFVIHPIFRKYIDLFQVTTPNIDKIGFLEAPMDEMIMRSSLMITDYSSVVWEMFYLKKPCVFIQFDKDKYLEYEGAYMDLDNDLFGDVTHNIDDLLTVIDHYIKNDFKEKQEYAELRNEYFTYMDHDNSERIYEAVKDNEHWLVKPLKLPKFKVTHLIPFYIRRKVLNFMSKILRYLKRMIM